MGKYSNHIKVDDLRAILKTESYICSEAKLGKYLDSYKRLGDLDNKKYLSPSTFFDLMFSIVQTKGKRNLYEVCNPFEQCEYTDAHPHTIVERLCTNKELAKDLDLVSIEEGYLIVRIYQGHRSAITIYKAQIRPAKEGNVRDVTVIPVSFFLKVQKMFHRWLKDTYPLK